ncbi:MAG: hypothetical protein AB7T10_04705 [bacterium]
MNFIDSDNEIIDASKFIEIWSKKYYQYTNITDKYYFDILKDIAERTDATMILTRIGAWKTNSLSTNSNRYSEEREIYRCSCEKPAVLCLTGMWKKGTSSGYEVWIKLSERFYNDIERIKIDSDAEEIINKISEMRYSGPRGKNIRFGKIYSYTYLHFLAPDKYFILDKFNKIALEFLKQPSKPSLPFSNEMKVNTFEDYLEYNEMIKTIQKNAREENNRNVDKALWSFGHWLKDQKERKEKIVCCKT